MSQLASVRVEHDMIGSWEVPGEARYGVHASRAAANFARPGARLLCDVPEFCTALGQVKLAAVRANRAAGVLVDPIAGALERACVQLCESESSLREELIVPLIQGGAGTSTNMNVNEVLANRALELMGFARGDYRHCHPNDHVNRSQSTNDVYPTALRVALIVRSDALIGAAERLELELRGVAGAHTGTLKLGRTQLQDALPMSVADEFHAWADSIASCRVALMAALAPLHEVNLGGTAIGTGATAGATYRERVVAELANVSGLELRRAARAVSATTDTTALLGYSAALRALAVALGKLASDLRLLSSGPRGGLGELRLPAVQAGSSLMPGKVNPVIAEFVNQLAFGAIGADHVVAAALEAGQLQLHAMLPVIASALFGSQADLRSAIEALSERCIAGLVVDERRDAELASLGLGEITDLAAVAGHDIAAAALARSTDNEAPPAAAGGDANGTAPSGAGAIDKGA